MASWLARSTLEQALRVRALAGDIVLCSWARHFTLKVPLSTQVYKWVLANLMPGVTPRWTSIPSRGEEKYSQSLYAIETGISSGLMGHLARMQTYFMIGLNCILQIMSVYYCTITKVNNKEYMPQSREVRSRFLVWSIVTSPLMSLMGSGPIAGYLLVSLYFCSSGSSTTCWYSFLLLCNEKHCKAGL